MERPTLDVDISESRSLEERRRRQWKKHMKSVLYIPTSDKQKAAYVLRKWRKKQRKLLGKTDIEDPDPFVETYVFYCFNK